jgi:hypothetical protein
MTPYQKEQMACLSMVREYLWNFPEVDKKTLKELMTDYLLYRTEVTEFLNKYFSEICSEKCFRSRLSACCSKDGIITFFADVVINVLNSEEQALDELFKVLQKDHQGFKCVYLSDKGCLWGIKPIVCEMFLCESAKKSAFKDHPEARRKWEELVEKKKEFTWPDRPILFDKIEEIFINAGCKSPLMYLHNSPGLLRVKKNQIPNKPNK